MKYRGKIFVICVTSILLFSGILVGAGDVKNSAVFLAKNTNTEGTLDCDIISIPPGLVDMVVYNGSNSYFDTLLSNVPAGYDVTNGWYLGWCSQKWVFIDRGVVIGVRLYSSYDPPASFSDDDWDKINYVLNNKQGDWADVQDVIWNYLEFPMNNPSDPDVLAMITDADTNGSGFCPGPGEIIAVLADAGSDIQRTFFEVLIPAEPYEGLTPGYWKNHYDEWQYTPYFTNTTIGSIFNVPWPQLMDSIPFWLILWFKGKGKGFIGAALILLRQAVAALLNAAHPLVNYQLTEAEIVTQVDSALATKNRNTILTLKDMLDGYNNLGCDDL